MLEVYLLGTEIGLGKTVPLQLEDFSWNPGNVIISRAVESSIQLFHIGSILEVRSSKEETKLVLGNAEYFKSWA